MSSAAVVYCRASSEMSDAEVAVCPNCLSAQPSKVTHLLHKHLAWPLQFCFLRLWNQHHNNGGRWHENCPCQSWGVQNWKTLVEHFLTNRGHKVFLISKFHCELNPIEKVWGQAKKFTHSHTNFTLPWLRQIIRPGLDSVGVDLIRKYFWRVREYEHSIKPNYWQVIASL